MRNVESDDRLLRGVQEVLRGFPITDREDFVHRALEVLGRAAGVGRAYVFENGRGPDGEPTASQRYEWCRQGVAPQIGNPDLQDVPYEAAGMSRWYELFERGQPVVGPVDEFPPAERDLLAAQDIRSLAALPIHVDGALWGFVGFDDVDHARSWSQAEESALLAAASAIGHEISRKRSEDHLLRTQRLEAVGSLAGGLAHDFNNMLSVVLGYGEKLYSRLDREDEESHHAVDRILQAAERSAQLTRQLLDFARKQIVEPRVIELGEFLPRFERFLDSFVDENVTLSFHLAPEPTPVFLDPGQLEQMIANFAINACDAMPRGGRILIETASVALDDVQARAHEVSPGEYVLLVVTDTGKGMPPEVLERAFEPFFTTKAEGRGTGLGLASARGIVERAGGTIRVYSEPNEGTTFKVYLPRAIAAPAAVEIPPPGRAMPRGGETVLLVENQPQLRDLLATTLAECGYDVHACAGLGETEAQLAAGLAGRLDLVLTDVVLTDGSGRDVVDAVRRRHPGTAALFMSGYTESIIVERGVLQPGIDFLPKPVTPSQVATKVRRVLDRRGSDAESPD